jgi:hypothetical protein
MSNITVRLEKLEMAAQLRTGRTFYVWLSPGESKEQALARYHAQYPTTTPDPTAEVMFITWHAPDDAPPDVRET